MNVTAGADTGSGGFQYGPGNPGGGVGLGGMYGRGSGSGFGPPPPPPPPGGGGGGSGTGAPGLPSGFDQTLHLILPTPHEMERALAEGWPLAPEVADVVRRDDFKVLYSDTKGRKVLRPIRAAAKSAETGWIVGGPKGAAAHLGMKRFTLPWKMKKSSISWPE